MNFAENRDGRTSAEIRSEVPPYSWYLLAVLWLVGTLNLFDRQVLMVLIEPIRHDLHLSDTRVGLLTGFAFSLVYGLVGLPVARLADRTSRRAVLGLSAIVWCAMTALGGMATSFWQLAASRVGVAAGEAGSMPASHALIGEHFPPSRRGLAMALFMLSSPIGTLLGFAAGGWLANRMPWREVLVMVGLPGMAIGLLALITVRDGRQPAPARGTTEGGMLALFRLASFRWLVLGFTLSGIVIAGFGTFLTPFLMRDAGFSAARAGLAAGVLFGVAGGLGMLASGWLTDRFGQRDPRWRLRIPAIAVTFAAIGMMLALTVADADLAVRLMFAPQFAAMIPIPATYAVAQSLAPPSSRSMATALLLLPSGTLAVGCGPLLVGMMSDALAPSLGASSLRHALNLLMPLQLVAAACYLRAARALPRDMDTARA